MRDIPFFATDSGIASLALREIPYRAEAYITIQNTNEPDKLLEECIQFCTMAGAEHIFARGHAFLERYPLYSTIWEMECLKADLEKTKAVLIPVDSESIDSWCKLYNSKMKNVPNAATITATDAKELLKRNCVYYVMNDGEQIGIGISERATLKAVASCKKGYGRESVLALCGILQAERVKLEVASTNVRAVKLYERLGFLKTKELHRWYSV